MAEINRSRNPEDMKWDKFPNLFIIGAPKCGTTSLHAILLQHPQIFMSSPKEPRFFSRDTEYEKGASWYMDTYFKNAGSRLIRGEATPTYLYFHKKTVPRIKSCLTEAGAKFIAIFRNPIDRAYSHYWFNRNTKNKLPENLSFEDALASEEQRMNDHPEFYEHGVMSQAYFRAGLYAEQIEPFINIFGRRNCLLLLTEDISPTKFASTVQTIEEFLTVDRINLEYARSKESIRFRSKTLVELMRNSRPLRMLMAQYIPAYLRVKIKSKIENMNRMPFKYPEMNPVTRNMLHERYKQSIIQFENVLGRNLSHWK